MTPDPNTQLAEQVAELKKELERVHSGIEQESCLQCHYMRSMLTPCKCGQLVRRGTNDHLREQIAALKGELAEARGLLNTPEFHDFIKAVPLEAAHQVQKWGSDHDACKTAADWFWLIGYLAQKAMYSELAGDKQKALHHCITTAAALCNWHAQILGTSPDNQAKAALAGADGKA